MKYHKCPCKILENLNLTSHRQIRFSSNVQTTPLFSLQRRSKLHHSPSSFYIGSFFFSSIIFLSLSSTNNPTSSYFLLLTSSRTPFALAIQHFSSYSFFILSPSVHSILHSSSPSSFFILIHLKAYKPIKGFGM